MALHCIFGNLYKSWIDSVWQIFTEVFWTNFIQCPAGCTYLTAKSPIWAKKCKIILLLPSWMGVPINLSIRERWQYVQLVIVCLALLVQEIEMRKLVTILSSVSVKVVGAVQAKNQRGPRGADKASTTGWTSSSLPSLELRLWIVFLWGIWGCWCTLSYVSCLKVCLKRDADGVDKRSSLTF